MSAMQKIRTIGPDNLITIGTALAIIIAVAGAAWRISAGLNELNHTLASMASQIDGMQKDAYTGRDHDRFAAQLAERNTGLRVPYWRDISAGRLVRDVRDAAP